MSTDETSFFTKILPFGCPSAVFFSFFKKTVIFEMGSAMIIADFVSFIIFKKKLFFGGLTIAKKFLMTCLKNLFLKGFLNTMFCYPHLVHLISIVYVAQITK